jgi:hypothetical protein
MKRNRFSSRKRISADATELEPSGHRLAESGSKLEDLFWQKPSGSELVNGCSRMAPRMTSPARWTASSTRIRWRMTISPTSSSRNAESCVMTDRGQDFDILLIAHAGTRLVALFDPGVGDPEGHPADAEGPSRRARVRRRRARVALADYLYSPDQLPHSFVETWQLLQQLGKAALAGSDLSIDAAAMPETNRFPLRHPLPVGALAVPRWHPIFRWNEADKSTRETVLKEWLTGRPLLRTPAHRLCAYQPLLADAYHAACRAADSASRPYSLNASVAFLQSALGLATRRKPARRDRRLPRQAAGRIPRSVSARATAT